ncbi:MAG: hypothetical protein ACE5LC_08470 [Candidatus Aminicenantales bacterium]
MRKIASLLLAILIVTLGCATKQTQEIEKLKQENEALKAMVGPPPSSLDAMYPPTTEQPVYQMRMMGMAVPLSAIFVNLKENDFQNVMPNFKNFKAQYTEVSKLVPEWEKDYPLEPVEELGKALESGEQEKVMEAFEKVGKVCSDCHTANMVKVQQKYHWMDFREIKATDPLTKEELDFTTFMQYLDGSFTGVMVDLQEGQMENALRHFEGFRARFLAMSDTCGDCHGTEERKYYIDKSVQTLVNNLGQALKNPSTKPEQFEGLMMGIGMESCGKCHLVHIPAAYAKLKWKK